MSEATTARGAATRGPALAGLKVIDFTIVMSGPMCTRMLVDAGADVIKVEPPEGDVVRQRPPQRGGVSTYYASMNCGKRSVVLDLQTDEGKRLARALVAGADVVVENFRPGVMKRLGLDYATLAKTNPRLIYASISGFGQTGPMASAPAYAPVIHAASGYERAYNEYQRGSDRPANNGIFIADVMGASYAFGAIQLALYERGKSGAGQHIDVSLMDSVLGMLVYEIQAAQFPPERPRQVYEPVRSSDGYVMVAAVTQKNLEVLFDTIGYPEGKTDPRFATVAAKETNWPALLALIERWTSTRTGAECEAVLMRAGVPCSRYRSVAEAMGDPQCAARELFVELGAGDQTYKVANPPYRLSATPVAVQRQVAGLGEHTDAVLRDELGLDGAAIAALRGQGAFGKARVKERAPLDPAALPGAEEREMLRESLRGFLATHWPPASAVARGADADAVATVWALLVQQGVAALGAEPGEGGLREIVVAMEELGRAACPAPMLGGALANLALADLAADDRAAAGLIGALHGGAARICWSFGALDPGDELGAVTVHDGTVTGTLRCVDGALAATHLVVATRGRRAASTDTGEAARDDDGEIAIVALAPPAARIAPTRALGAEGAFAEITLAAAPASFVALGATALADLLRVARIAVLARAHGAARRAFEIACDYAKERRQFGQPIGRFQAIQHKLANGLIALEGVRLTLAHAAESFDVGADAWRYFGAATAAFSGPALRQVSLETQHAFGAIGYAEEHEAPRHFKRSHLDALAFGGAAATRRELAVHLLDDPKATVPEYDLGSAGNAFRAEVRAWLEAHWSCARKAAFDAQEFHAREFDPSFARDLGTTGWIGLGWPRAFGGQARTPLEQLAFMEVMERAEAPRTGAAVQANALMIHGTAEQQARYLPEILRGEAMHGMGYSEPDAGSDLASLRTSAVRLHDEHGDHWVINGQKIWTTTYWGKYMFLAARSNREAKPAHAGINMFIVPMDAPGITIKPATTMYDGRFANIFYDDVRIPADAIVGPVDGGWKVLSDALANERGTVGGGIVLKVAHAFDLLCRDVREQGTLRDDALVRDRIATLAAEIEVGRRLMIHCAELATSGTTPPEVGAISKVFSGELMERFGEAALDILGPRAALSQGAAAALRNGRYEQGLRHSLMWVISIGTNEIQRSLIAQRGLGLPR